MGYIHPEHHGSSYSGVLENLTDEDCNEIVITFEKELNGDGLIYIYITEQQTTCSALRDIEVELRDQLHYMTGTSPAPT